MSTVWQQQVFALDARYNAHRAKNHPNFRTLYIRRRNQLLREFGGGKDSVLWKQYIKLRGTLLQMRYGSSFDQTSLRRLSINTRVSPDSPVQFSDVDSIKEDESKNESASSSMQDNYSFTGVYHIFDQHTSAVTMVKFAHNDRSRLCCISNDGTVSICNLEDPPRIECILKGHEKEVTGCDWSFANDLIVTCSLDGQICIWNTSTYKCIRSVKDKIPAEIFSCLFHPVNNNVVIAGNAKGHVEVLNISTGFKNRNNVGGKVLSMAFDSSGCVLWAGNDLGYIMSFWFDIKSGKLKKHKRIFVGVNAAITSLNWKSWMNKDARDPSLLVNIAANMIHLYRVTDKGLELKRGFTIRHADKNSHIRSTFCPLMSIKKGACIVTGSEDSCVYFLDIACDTVTKAIVNKLQGHSSPVLGVSFNYDESLLSSSDQQGLVIIWKRDTKTSK